MKITFIRLEVFGDNYKSFVPIVFPIIASLTPKDIDITFIDEHVEALPDKIDSDIIAFSIETFAAKKAYILAKKYKTLANHIVMGGFHPSIEPEECLEFADTVIIGDAEDTWGRFISDFKEGCANKVYKSSLTEIPNKIDYKFPYFTGKSYSYIGAIQTSRGCKFKCDFCAIKTMYPETVRFKNVADTVAEIKELKEKYFLFVDDNLFLNEKSLFELLEEIKPLKKQWGCQISMDVAKNDNLLSAMRESGCRMVLIGFESINKETLQKMNKGANRSIEQYDEVIKKIYSYGIMIYAAFIFGYDTDDMQTFEDTVQFALKYHFTLAAFHLLQPMPGTNLYKRLEGEKRLLFNRWWLSEEYRYGFPVFKPINFTEDELRLACYNAIKKFYSIPNIFKRFILNTKFISLKLSLVFLFENFSPRKLLRRNFGKRLRGNLLYDASIFKKY